MYQLTDDITFPHPLLADENGVLAIGGDLSTERLALAYSYGIFPWFNEGEPIVWWSPAERFVLFPDELKVSQSMQKVLRQEQFLITYNQRFAQVVRQCKEIKRKGQAGTWITDEMEQAYIGLHEKGMAQSVEVWQHGELVGGLYGVAVGRVFCGESMFAKVSNASKAGFVSFVQRGDYELFDCQVYTAHLESMGARHISREKFLRSLGVEL